MLQSFERLKVVAWEGALKPVRVGVCVCVCARARVLDLYSPRCAELEAPGGKKRAKRARNFEGGRSEREYDNIRHVFFSLLRNFTVVARRNESLTRCRGHFDSSRTYKLTRSRYRHRDRCDGFSSQISGRFFNFFLFRKTKENKQ